MPHREFEITIGKTGEVELDPRLSELTEVTVLVPEGEK